MQTEILENTDLVIVYRIHYYCSRYPKTVVIIKICDEIVRRITEINRVNNNQDLVAYKYDGLYEKQSY